MFNTGKNFNKVHIIETIVNYAIGAIPIAFHSSYAGP
jgi:hypothetical protein